MAACFVDLPVCSSKSGHAAEGPKYKLAESGVGLSSGGTAALFYAARVMDVPAIFMAEPDEMKILSGKLNSNPADACCYAEDTAVML